MKGQALAVGPVTSRHETNASPHVLVGWPEGPVIISGLTADSVVSKWLKKVALKTVRDETTHASIMEKEHNSITSSHNYRVFGRHIIGSCIYLECGESVAWVCPSFAMILVIARTFSEGFDELLI